MTTLVVSLSTVPTLILDARVIANQTQAGLLTDLILTADLDGDHHMDTVIYDFSRQAAPVTCDTACPQNDGLFNRPQLTISFILHGKRINLPFFCEQFGYFNNQHAGMPDLWCGPDTRLRWNGQEYIQHG